VRHTHFEMNRAFKIIQGHPCWCWQKSRTVCCPNVHLMPTLFLKLTKIWQRKNGKFVGQMGHFLTDHVDHYMLTHDRPLFHQPSVTCCFLKLWRFCHSAIKRKLHYFDLLWICYTTYPQQTETTEFGLKAYKSKLIQ